MKGTTYQAKIEGSCQNKYGYKQKQFLEMFLTNISSNIQPCICHGHPHAGARSHCEIQCEPTPKSKFLQMSSCLHPSLLHMVSVVIILSRQQNSFTCSRSFPPMCTLITVYSPYLQYLSTSGVYSHFHIQLKMCSLFTEQCSVYLSIIACRPSWLLAIIAWSSASSSDLYHLFQAVFRQSPN